PIFVVVLPFLFGGIAHKKLAIGWKYFWFGALVMLVAQPLTRVPLIKVLQNTVLAPLLRTSITFTWIWVAIQAVTAGLCYAGTLSREHRSAAAIWPGSPVPRPSGWS